MAARKTLTIAVAAMLSAVSAFGQNNTTYFLDNYVYSYKLNPAAKPADAGFFGGIGFGGLNIGLNSNTGVSNFFFPVDGKLVTGLNEAVSADEFLSGLKDPISTGFGIDKNILSLGFVSKNKFVTTFDISSRTMVDAQVPKGLFELLKKGSDRNDNYEFGDVALGGSSYLEAALGFSFPIGPVRAGIRVKGLAGLADVKADIVKASAGRESEEVHIDASGNIRMAPNLPDDDFKAKELLTPSGIGAAIDLGMSLNTKLLQVDFAILDLGGIKWKYDYMNSFTYSGVIGDDTEAEDILDDIIGSEGSHSELSKLNATLSAGARVFILPKLSAGLHATLNKQAQDIRAGVTFTPGRVFSLAATGGMTSFGPCFGAGFNLLLPGVSLYAAIDDIVTEFTPQFIPVNAVHTKLSAGLVIAIK